MLTAVLLVWGIIDGDVAACLWALRLVKLLAAALDVSLLAHGFSDSSTCRRVIEDC